MTVEYTTARSLKNQLWRWSQQVSYTTPTGYSYAVNPTTAGQVTQTLDGGFQVFRKTGGGDNWNTIVYGTVPRTAGEVIYTNMGTPTPSPTGYGTLMLGLSENPLAGTSFSNIRWGLSMYSWAGGTSGTMEYYNAGSSAGTIAGGFNSTVQLRIRWTTTGGSGNGTVRWSRNGVEQATIFNKTNQNPLYWAVCMYSQTNPAASAFKVLYYGAQQA